MIEGTAARVCFKKDVTILSKILSAMALSIRNLR